MRKCEVEDLRLGDLFLAERRLLIRRSKGLKDRTIYLTDRVVAALEAYLDMRGTGLDDTVFLYRQRQISKPSRRCKRATWMPGSRCGWMRSSVDSSHC